MTMPVSIITPRGSTWLAAVWLRLVVWHPGLSLGKLLGGGAGRDNLRNNHVLYFAQSAPRGSRPTLSAVPVHLGDQPGDDRGHDDRIVPMRVVYCDRLAGRQLQYCRALTFAQLRQQDGPSVGELKGIMMDV